MLKFITKTVYAALVAALLMGANVSNAGPCNPGLPQEGEGYILSNTTWSADRHVVGTIIINLASINL